MKVIEEVRDILDVPKKYFICHASSADLDMSTGLAKVINNTYDLANGLKDKYSCVDEELSEINVGNAVSYGHIITLFVKKKSYDKVRFGVLEKCIEELERVVMEEGVRYIAFPKICCGNMGLKWGEVKSLIEKQFSSTDLEILFCYDKAEDIVPKVESIIDPVKERWDSLDADQKQFLSQVIKSFLEDIDNDRDYYVDNLE